MGEPLLELSGIVAGYGPVRVLEGLSLTVNEGEVVTLLGGNGAGKTTTMKVILGLLRPNSGTVKHRGEEITGRMANEIVSRGIAIVPEGRRIFPRMTVRENLGLGAYLRTDGRAAEQQSVEEMFELFPRLRERHKQLGGTLSGGEQQMLAIARALMSKPQLLLMDEPSMGLAPSLVDQVFDIIRDIHARGTSILLVEQAAHMALGVADRGYVLQTGQVVAEGPAAELAASEDVKAAYLGGH